MACVHTVLLQFIIRLNIVFALGLFHSLFYLGFLYVTKFQNFRFKNILKIFSMFVPFFVFLS